MQESGVFHSSRFSLAATSKRNKVAIIARGGGNFLRAFFYALIGNHDRHGRNLGLIRMPSGHDLSPIYDNPSYLAIEDFLEAEHHPTGAIATGHNKEPSMGDYVMEFCRLGYSELVKKFYYQVRRDLPSLLDLIRCSFVSDKRKRAFQKLVEKRFHELHTSLNKSLYESSRG